MWAVVMCGAVSTAQAADMPDLPILRGAFTDGLTSSRPNWQGYYVGGQADWGSITSKVSPAVNSDLRATFVTPGPAYTWAPVTYPKGSNGGFGAFAGYNSQWDDVVIGVEANYIHFGFKNTSAGAGYTYNGSNSIIATTYNGATVSVSDFGSLRLRAAYAVGCFLPYAFIGGGVGSQTIDRFAAAYPAPVLTATTSASKTKLVYGYSAGVGFDVMLVGGLFARAEYEYQRVTADFESNINTVRAGLGYKF
jgi:opacity protein-like surface antigen